MQRNHIFQPEFNKLARMGMAQTCIWTMDVTKIWQNQISS